MRISDWSSDVCSSDLALAVEADAPDLRREAAGVRGGVDGGDQRLAVEAVVAAVGVVLPSRPVGRKLGPAVAQHCHHAAIGGECDDAHRPRAVRSEEHTSELQSLMRISYAVFCL